MSLALSGRIKRNKMMAKHVNRINNKKMIKYMKKIGDKEYDINLVSKMFNMSKG